MTLCQVIHMVHANLAWLNRMVLATARTRCGNVSDSYEREHSGRMGLGAALACVAVLALACGSAQAQTPTFGPVPVGTTTLPSALTYQFNTSTTLSAVNILTSGASGLDYGDGGGSTCAVGTTYSAGNSCTVTVAFTPTVPGARAGAVTLYAQGSNVPLMTWYLSGIGQSGAVTVDPGTLTTATLIGTLTPSGYGSAVDAAGNVYVVDHANNAVLKLTPGNSGTFSQSTVVCDLSGPTGVALDGAGNLYISNGSSVVMVPNENGTLNQADQSTVAVSGLGAARGIAVDDADNLYVADAANNDVVELSSSGAQTMIASGLTSPPHGVAVDAGGNVYVATDNAVTEYPLGGGMPVQYGMGFNNPRGVAVDAAGNVYVADTGNNQIVEVAPGGASQTVLAIAGLSAPQGISLDSSDNVYVTYSNMIIQDNRTQAAQLNFPSTNVGSTSATQSITVSDSGNQQLNLSNLLVSTNFSQEPSGETECTSSTILSSGGQCGIVVAFVPTVSGTLPGTITLADNALNNLSNMQMVQLSGSGTQVTQTITFSLNAPASAAYNSNFSVAATGGESGNPIMFTSSGSCTNVGATYTMTSGTGTCTVNANQAGSAEYSAAPQVTQSTTAMKSGQTITFTMNAPLSATYNSQFTVAASASSSLAITYTSSGGCVNSGATYTMTSGTTQCMVMANQAGNTNYFAATQSTQSAANPAASTVALGSNANPSVYNQSVTFTATITPQHGGMATGTITFKDGANTIGNVAVNANMAQLVTNALAIGSHSITATYSGDANVTGSLSPTLAQVAKKAGTVSTVVSSSNPSVVGQAVTFTVTVSPQFSGTPTGTVVLKGAGANQPLSLIAGQATYTTSSLGLGTFHITASYGGDANFNTSSSAALAQVVKKEPTSISVVSGENPSSSGQSVTFTATVTSSIGPPPAGETVTFTKTVAGVLTTLGTGMLSANGTATFITSSPLSVGTTYIYAIYSGDANFNTSESKALEQVVEKDTTTTVVTPSQNPITVGQPVTFTATVSSSNGAPPNGEVVTFKNGATTLCSCTLSSGTATFITSSLGGGSASIKATYSGDANFDASTSAALTETVNKYTTSSSVVSGENPSSSGQSVTFTATVTSSSGLIPTGTVTLKNGTATLGAPQTLSSGVASFTTSTLAVGTHSITVVYNGDANDATSTSQAISQVVDEP
jgi:large repetitive protein